HQLRRVIFGGEALEVSSLHPWYEQEQNHGTQLINMYGITETTVHVTYRALQRADTKKAGSPIGSRIPDLTSYILDGDQQPVPTGVAGELYIGGAGVARGYLHQAGMTAERFVPDGFSSEQGARMYRTGDLGRWLPDGNIEFVGRNDEQVKIRGYRIELGEIEARLAAHSLVGEAVVVAREDGPVGKALPAPEADAYGVSRYEAPEGEIETAVAGIWAEVLKQERIGRQDNFFALGGHSLLAVRVVSRIRQALGKEVAIRDLFAQPVLRDFAGVVERARQSELPAITRVERGERVPLSFAQQRLWFVAQIEGGSAAYHVPFGVRLEGELNRGALRQALDRIVARHEALRTSFAMVDGQPAQRIAAADESRFQLLEEDLRRHEDAVGELQRVMAEESGKEFDLAAGPLIRGRLIQLAEQE